MTERPPVKEMKRPMVDPMTAVRMKEGKIVSAGEAGALYHRALCLFSVRRRSGVR